MRKTQKIMNKSVHLGLSILDVSKTYKFWSDYVKKNMVKMQNFVIWIQKALLFL